MPKRHHWIQVTILLVGASCSATRPARAAAPESCRIQGVTEPNLDTVIEDDSGQVIARFTGSATPVEIKQIPTMPSVRARIATSIPEVQSLRIEGFASVRALGIRTRSRIDVVSTMVWLPPGIRLDGVVRIGNELFVEKRLERDFSQTLVARSSCEQLGLSPVTTNPDPPPGSARIYRFERDHLPLFDAAMDSARPRITLQRQASTASVLFFAIASAGNWVSLRYDGEVAIAAWAKKSDLTALPAGEIQDQPPRSSFERSVPKLGLGGSPQLLRAPRAVPVRTQANASAPPIGEVESEAEFYVIEVVSGWASIVPRSLGVMPAPNRHFWIEARSVGL